MTQHAHLSVDAVTQNLRHHSARGGALMIVSYAIQLVLGVTGTAVLARILRPTDFGYLAMVATLTNFVATFRDFGLPMAAVQKQELSHAQASGLFWVNALASVVVAALLASVAPALAWFYAEPKLLMITLVMAGGVLIHSLSMVHVGLLRRQMNFRAVTMLEVGAVIAGILVGVGAAIAGFGYWSLVFQQVAIYIVQAAGALVLCSWRPLARRESASIRDPELRAMLRYGKEVASARVVAYIGRNVDSVAVGYFIGPAILGLYQKAYQWSLMPFWQIYSPLAPVAVSSFSRLQDDAERYRGYARTTLLALFSLTLPATVLLFIEAEPVTLLLLGPQWVQAIPFFRILACGAYFASFALVTNWLYLAEGRTRQQLRWAFVAAPVSIVAVAIGIKWGAIGVAYGFAIASALLALPGVLYALHGSPLRPSDFFGAIARPVIASLVAAIPFLVARDALPHAGGMVMNFLVESLIYSIVYVACWIALPGGREQLNRVIGHARLLLPS